MAHDRVGKVIDGVRADAWREKVDLCLKDEGDVRGCAIPWDNWCARKPTDRAEWPKKLSHRDLFRTPDTEENSSTAVECEVYYSLFRTVSFYFYK